MTDLLLSLQWHWSLVIANLPNCTSNSFFIHPVQKDVIEDLVEILIDQIYSVSSMCVAKNDIDKLNYFAILALRDPMVAP